MVGLHALVVDDSKVGRLTMLKKLEAIGIQVDLAESGREALDYLASRRPEMIFMDHMMPEMDGFEVTRRIKATPGMADIPVIIVSGNDEPAFVDEARAAGAIDAIAKPPPPGVLEALLAGLSKVAAPLEAAPARGATFDQDALRDWLEQQLEVALAPFRDAFDELTLGERERRDEQRAAVAGLRAELQVVGDRLEQDLSGLRATVAAVHEAQWARLAEQQAQQEAGLEEARSRLESLAKQRESPAILAPKAEPKPEIESVAAPPAEYPARSDDVARDELARLKNRLNALTLALAIGGGALLLAVGMLLLG